MTLLLTSDFFYRENFHKNRRHAFRFLAMHYGIGMLDKTKENLLGIINIMS